MINKKLILMVLSLTSASSVFAMWFTPGCNQNAQKKLLSTMAAKNPQGLRNHIVSTQLNTSNKHLSIAQAEWQSSLKIEEVGRHTNQPMCLQMNMKISTRIDGLRVEEAQKRVQCWNEILAELDQFPEGGFKSEEERKQAVTNFVSYANEKTSSLHTTISGIARNMNKLNSVKATSHTSNKEEEAAAIQVMEQTLAAVDGTVANGKKPAVALKAENNKPNGDEDEVKGNHQAPLPPIDPATPNNASNKPDGAGKSFFFAGNRKYITGIAISAAVVGTVYFYGHRIKAWITAKPVSPKPVS